jgi:hypothetical protein
MDSEMRGFDGGEIERRVEQGGVCGYRYSQEKQQR